MVTAGAGRFDIFFCATVFTRTNTCCGSSKSRILIRRLGELLFANDARWNSAFEDFARKVGTPEARILHGVGALRKNGA